MAESEVDHAMKQELLRLDILLRRKQVFWDTPRGVLLVVATTAALVAAVAGFIGFKIGQTPPQPIVIQIPK
jgi:hypothetical protein